MASDRIDVAIVGGGVVGLAVGRELSRRGGTVAVFERNPRPGQETSSRQSGVIHAGLYYPSDTLKARLCLEGRRALYEFCRRHHVAHARVGKLIVATNRAEEAGLEALLEQGRHNGVEGLRLVTAAEVQAREPEVRATAGLLSEVSGIVSSDELVAALERRMIAAGGVLLTGQEVVGLGGGPGDWCLGVRPARGEPYEVRAAEVVNAAGLWAGDVAGWVGDSGLRVHYCKGEYFWTTRALVRGLVYPLPEAGLRGLGVHATVDLDGRVRFGPDTTYVAALDYQVDPGKAPAFHRTAARYLPDLRVEDLQPDMAGVRPKLAAGGEGFRDFVVERGASGVVHLAGIESPGLTSCLALGREVADRL